MRWSNPEIVGCWIEKDRCKLGSVGTGDDAAGDRSIPAGGERALIFSAIPNLALLRLMSTE